jgi:hypothetical protein
MKNIVLFASITIAAGLLVTNIYNSLVDARSWGSDIPRSIATLREYYKTVNPGNFFRIFSPANQVLALLALLLFWRRSPEIRLFLGIALISYVFSDIITFAYFYPRNEIMSKTPLMEVGAITKAWKEWSGMNWVRSLIVFIGLIFSFFGQFFVFCRPHS